jgi:hypothetical protein
VRDWLYPYVCGAGLGAQARYRQVCAAWQMRVFRRPALIAGALAAPILAGGIIERRHLWIWVGGVFAGMVLTAYVWLLESPPAHIERWRTGLEGERHTARALAPLRRSGFELLHDLPDRDRGATLRCGNLDHVVVSPAGVFLLDSKWLAGEASLAGETVYVQMRDDEDDAYEIPHLARAMRGRALRLQQDIVAQTGIRFIQPVVVFWNRFQVGTAEAGDVVFLHGSRVASWLEQQPAALSPDAVAAVAERIKRQRPPAHRPLTFGRAWRSLWPWQSRPPASRRPPDRRLRAELPPPPSRRPG